MLAHLLRKPTTPLTHVNWMIAKRGPSFSPSGLKSWRCGAAHFGMVHVKLWNSSERFWLTVAGFVATSAAGKCPDILLKLPGFVATNLAGKCPDVSLEIPALLQETRLEQGSAVTSTPSTSWWQKLSSHSCIGNLNYATLKPWYDTYETWEFNISTVCRNAVILFWWLSWGAGAHLHSSYVNWQRAFDRDSASLNSKVNYQRVLIAYK